MSFIITEFIIVTYITTEYTEVVWTIRSTVLWLRRESCCTILTISLLRKKGKGIFEQQPVGCCWVFLQLCSFKRRLSMSLLEATFQVLEAVLGENPQEEFKVTIRGTINAEVRLPLYVSLDGINSLPLEFRNRLQLSFDGDVSVITINS